MPSTVRSAARFAPRRVLVPLLALPLLAGTPVCLAPAQAVAATTASVQASLSVNGIDTFDVGGRLL